MKPLQRIDPYLVLVAFKKLKVIKEKLKYTCFSCYGIRFLCSAYIFFPIKTSFFFVFLFFCFFLALGAIGTPSNLSYVQQCSCVDRKHNLAFTLDKKILSSIIVQRINESKVLHYHLYSWDSMITNMISQRYHRKQNNDAFASDSTQDEDELSVGD